MIIQNILIFSASIGNGHNQAAEALSEELEKIGYKCEVIDTLQFINPVFHKMILDGYLKILKFFPNIWRKLYNHTEKHPWYMIMDNFGTIFCNKLYSKINESKCISLISVHPFSTAILSKMKNIKKVHIPLYSVITDFVLHPAYFRNEVDGYFTASDQLDYYSSRYNVPLSKIHSTGIPIRSIPSLMKSKLAIKHELNLDDKKKTILITGGAIGLTKFTRVLKALNILESDLQIICLTGHNKKATKEIDKVESKHKIVSIGFTNRFTDYLRASDVIISKAGGLTMAESLACETPIIIYQPVPGHEEHNTQYLLKYGAALTVEFYNDIPVVLEKLLFNENFYNSMLFNIQKIQKPYAAAEIINKINLENSKN